MLIKRLLIVLSATLASAAPAAGEDPKTPYWASIRSSEVNMRAGPGEEYGIDWVYRREHLPIKVLRLKEGWRFVEDPGGTRGWMLARFLTRERSAIVVGTGLADMREAAGDTSKLLWRVEPGVVGLLGECSNGWCDVRIGEHRGQLRQERLWGAGEP